MTNQQAPDVGDVQRQRAEAADTERAPVLALDEALCEECGDVFTPTEWDSCDAGGGQHEPNCPKCAAKVECRACRGNGYITTLLGVAVCPCCRGTR